MEQAHGDVASDPGPVVEAGPAADVKRLVGTVKELWRYPVKSMLGGAVSALLVTEQGGLGDRAWALRDRRNGRIVSAKRIPRLLEFRATYEVEPTPESAGVVRIETPEGDTLYAGQEDASARISSILGRPVVLDNFAHPDEKASIDRNTVFGDVPVSQMKPDWTLETMPDYFQLKSGSFLEIGAVFVLASGSVEHLRCLQGGTALIDRRRFRPNLYIDTGQVCGRFVEDDWRRETDRRGLGGPGRVRANIVVCRVNAGARGTASRPEHPANDRPGSSGLPRRLRFGGIDRPGPSR